MAEVLKSLPPLVLVLLGMPVVLLVAGIVVWALREGREVSFWPPRIGPRPAPQIQDTKKSAPAAEPRRDGGLDPVRPVNEVQGVEKALTSFDAAAGEGPHWVGGRRLDLSKIIELELIGKTEHSQIFTCRVPELGHETLVLKSTKRELCDVNAVGMIADAPPHMHEAFVLPMAVWTRGDRMFELMPYADGFPLSSLQQAPGSRWGIRGKLLRDCVMVMSSAIGWLRSKRLVHRDITPYNLYVQKQRITLIDWSFTCQADLPQTPVGTAGFADPEQQKGRASEASDWFSFAATLCFLANGDGEIPQDGVSWRRPPNVGNVFGDMQVLDYEYEPGGASGRYLEHLIADIIRSRGTISWLHFMPSSGRPIEPHKQVILDNVRAVRRMRKDGPRHLLLADKSWHIMPDDLEAAEKLLGDHTPDREFAEFIRKSYAREWPSMTRA
jgi:hypothetical protein